MAIILIYKSSLGSILNTNVFINSGTHFLMDKFSQATILLRLPYGRSLEIIIQSWSSLFLELWL